MRSFKIIAAICGLSFAGVTATAQMSDADIENAVQAMRDAGIAESQIEKFKSDIEAANATMQAFNETPPAELPELNSGDELLADQRAKFQTTYGTAPDATIQFRGDTYVLKVTNCDRGEGWFIIDAKTQPGPGSAVFGAVLNTNPDGSSYAILDFQTGNARAGATLSELAMDGNNFVFDGNVEESSASDPEPLSVSLACAE